MATSTAATFDAAFRLTLSDGTNYPGLRAAPSLIPPTLSFTSGSSAGSVDLAATPNQVTATASLNLYDGTVKTPLGAAAAFRKVSTFVAYNAGTASAVLGGNFVTVNFGGTHALGAGAVFAISDPSGGFAVATGTADTLTVTVASGVAAVRLALAGTAE